MKSPETVFILLIFCLSGFSQIQPSISPIDGFGKQNIVLAFQVKAYLDSVISKFHGGIDFAVKEGTAVLVTADGTILVAKENQGHYGYIIRMQHDHAFETIYAHLSQIMVHEGMEVKMGDIIGYSGKTGLANNPNLHYEIHRDGKRADPAGYLPD